jgi:ribonuclease PH
VEILSDDGGVLAAAINAVYIALADSGIKLRTGVVAINTCMNTLQPAIDPSSDEEYSADAVITYIMNSMTKELVCVFLERGSIDLDSLENSLHLLQKASDELRDMIISKVPQRKAVGSL